MKSKNKKAQTVAEKEYVGKIAQMSCVVCECESGSEVHEFEQGAWFTSVPLCVPCHRGPEGWHGTRLRWKLRNMDMVKAINKTVGRYCEQAQR